jgi:acyl-coenzyme A synthetase/AMP-(fatty) acid ligase
VRATVTAGEALPAPLQQRFAERFGHPVLDGIGTTEALHIFVSNQTGNERAGTSGMPVEGYAIRLISEAGDVVITPDTPGYLQVKARHLLRATGVATRRRGRHSRVNGFQRVMCTPCRPTATGRSSAATTT